MLAAALLEAGDERNEPSLEDDDPMSLSESFDVRLATVFLPIFFAFSARRALSDSSSDLKMESIF